MRRVAAMLLALMMLVGCQEGGKTPEPTPEPTPAVTPEPIQAPPRTFDVIWSGERTAETDAAYTNFALELLRQSRVEGENTLMSPLSVTLALGMTAQGAAGDTAEEFEQLFGMDCDTLFTYCRALMEGYSDPGGSTEANLVNSLWCDPDLTLETLFTADCIRQFGAELFHADLQSPDTVKAVNDWVSEATHGMIPQVVDRFDEYAALALINAVYFKNQFQTPFATPTHEWTLDFHNADGTVGKPQGMHNDERKELYLTHDKGQGVVLPYDDGRLGLLLMLPDEGVSLTDYLSGWDGSTVAGLLNDQAKTRVSLTVPKFKAEWSGELGDALQAMGLVDAFDPHAADFTPMGHSENGPLFIGQVIHKTAFEVNEKGTEAAAVTAAVMMDAAAARPDDMVILTFDRPFVYGIVDLDTGAPLFLGTLEHLD